MYIQNMIHDHNITFCKGLSIYNTHKIYTYFNLTLLTHYSFIYRIDVQCLYSKYNILNNSNYVSINIPVLFRKGLK